MTQDEIYMLRCLELAQRAKGYTAPNPMVGAVLVCDGSVIGEGWHRNYGGNHAEVNCLNSVSEENRHLIPQSTMYVSLEPCAHYGKTPPCASRLVAEKVKRVVICNEDPFKEVSGRGIEILKGAGVDMQSGILEKEGLWVNRRFFCFHSRQRPYIILKWAQTADGYFAPADGSQLQISNEHSKQLLHKWRTEEGAILVGTNTALADDPNLTARLWEGKQPLRILIDKELKVPATYNVYNSDAASWIINEKDEVLDGNVHRIKMDFDDSLPDKIFARLYEQKILSIIIEGGAAVLNRIIEAGLWDEARIFNSSTSLQNGIAAPLLKDHVSAFTSAIGDDVLEVYTHAKSGYAYVAGMEL